MKIDWKQKLSSRKLWLAIAGIVSGIAMILFGNATEGAALIGSSIVGYLAAEGYIDGKRAASAAIIVKEVANGIADALKDKDIPSKQEGTDD